MKGRKSRFGAGIKCFGLIGLVAGALCLGGCGSGEGYGGSSGSAAASAAKEMNGYATDDIYEAEYASETAAQESGESRPVAANRKLIRTIHMDVETEEFDTLVARLEQRVADLGGYIENMNIYNGSRSAGQRLRDASMVVRIPKEKLDMFVREVSESSNVISKSENTEDVTLSYVDLESRKKALQVEQERLLELLEQAVSMEDIIAIEERLSQVRYELESMESQLRTYDNLVDYSTVYLSVDEVEKLTPVEEISDFSRMVQGFGHSVENLFVGIKEFLIGLVINLPYLIFLVALAALAILFARFLAKGSRKKREHLFRAMAENMERGEGENRRTGFGMPDAGNGEINVPETGAVRPEPGTAGTVHGQEPEAVLPEPGKRGRFS